LYVHINLDNTTLSLQNKQPRLLHTNLIISRVAHMETARSYNLNSFFTARNLSARSIWNLRLHCDIIAKKPVISFFTFGSINIFIIDLIL